MRTILCILVLALSACACPHGTKPPACLGDCNGDGRVCAAPDVAAGKCPMDEIGFVTQIALGQADLSTCPAAAGPNGQVTTTEISTAIYNNQHGCPK